MRHPLPDPEVPTGDGAIPAGYTSAVPACLDDPSRLRPRRSRAGAGAAFPSRNGCDTSLTELFVEPTHPGAFPLSFTWAKNVLPYLPR